MRTTAQLREVEARTRPSVLVLLSLVACIGCQANQPSAKSVLAEIHGDMWQHELEQLMRSRGAVLLSVRGTGANGQDWDYRLGDEVLRVWLGYPTFPVGSLDGYRHERNVGRWEIVDIEAERRLEKEYQNMDSATKLQMLEELGRATEEAEMQDWPPPPGPDPK